MPLGLLSNAKSRPLQVSCYREILVMLLYLRRFTCIRPRIRTAKRDARCTEFVRALDDPNWSLTRRDDFIDRLLPGTEGRPVLSRGGTRYLASASSTATHQRCGCSVRSTVPSAFHAKLLNLAAFSMNSYLPAMITIK